MKQFLRVVCWFLHHPVEDPEGHYVQIQESGKKKKERPVRLGKPGMATCSRCGMRRVLNERNYKRIVAA